MRLLPVAPDVWVGVSRAWQTAVTVCGPNRQLIIDGPVLPDELAWLAGAARPAALIATHADWDHLLAPLAFPAAARRAGAATIERLRSRSAQIGREQAAWDATHGVAPRGLPDWTEAETLGAPGGIDSPVGPIAITATPGHTADGIALLLMAPRVLVAGDYVSPREVPALDAQDGCADYLASLDRLASLMARARVVIPGHGWPLDAARARTILDEDRRYVTALAAGHTPALPRAAADPVQQAQHRANLAAALGG